MRTANEGWPPEAIAARRETAAEHMAKRCSAVLDYMREHLTAHQRLPSVREIAVRFKVTPAQAHNYLSALVDRGQALPAYGRARGYRLAGVRVVLTTEGV